MSRVLRALDRHWFAPASLRELAVVRIVVVAGQLFLFYPPLAWELWLAGADPKTYLPIPALKVLMLPFGHWGVRPGPMFLHAVWLLGIVAGVLAIIGLSTRLSLFVFAAVNTLLIAHTYSYGEYHHPEAVMVIALWVLAASPAGAAWSVDALKRRIHGALASMRFEPQSAQDDLSPFARWPVRLIQWVLALAYLSAALSKLGNSGLSWFNGYTLAYYWIQDGLRFNVVGQGASWGIWLSHHLMLASALSIGATFIELTFVLAVLVPRMAWFYVLAGAGMHTAIYFAQGAPFFQYIVLYIVFIEALRQPFLRHAPVVASASAAISTPEPVLLGATRHWTIIYDGLCPLCVRSMVVLDFLDVRHRLRFIDMERDWARAAALAPRVTPAEAHHLMHVVSPDGQVYRGFFAFRALARALPLLWPLLPLYHAPFASVVGPRIYGGIARVRGTTPCRVETCGV
ncbi:MAG TPA: DCC1-like thiol-disulfide oxidoreductase family protein [Gemmatimonadaceae bacterium]|nr:DCC1-like thiol-disulfide oxidoreductase family protein [Gemmatimonadaceae bacterium]